MHDSFQGWSVVARHLTDYATQQQELETAHGLGSSRLNAGQRASLLALAQRLVNSGVVIADEVGMGKTRIAVTLARAVTEAGGRVAILVPPGLGFQWRDELREGGVASRPIVRSLLNFFDPWWHSATPASVQPWFADPAVVVSHAFTNWRLSDTSASWRWALLPELYARWRKRTTGRLPRGYVHHEALLNADASATAQSICDAIPDDPDNRAYRLCAELSEQTPWPAALDAAEYARNRELRPWLERAVGLGLGVFDLVIVDEAHKSRGDDSGLSRLLESVIQRSPSARTVAMTATPVELDIGQWEKTLARIGVDIRQTSAVTPGVTLESAIKAYSDAVKRVRLSPSSSAARQSYADAAESFQTKLSPFLLRRDKREDESVVAFAAHSKLSANAYRNTDDPITVEMTGLPLPWKQAVCAAEALSMLRQQEVSNQSKRLRLTIGNGHGLTSLLDKSTQHATDDAWQEKADEALLADEVQEALAFNRLSETTAPGPASIKFPNAASPSKRKQRAQWWERTIGQAFAGEHAGLFDHPALLACITAIEEATSKGEKVLVFGRFTAPLRALVDLLNAREMLRCLQHQRPWPQSKIHDNGLADGGDIPAVNAALRQLGVALTAQEMNDSLARQYQALENRRERWRAGLLEKIAAGLGMASRPFLGEQPSRVRQLFAAFSSAAQPELALVGKALYELMGDDGQATPAQFADAFEQLVNALSDRNEGDQDGDGMVDAKEAQALWQTLADKLRDEYNRPQGGFARLMFGGTAPDARRMIQLAFNRTNSFPKVLVAQSMVGREGLNLHKACSTVILLHPEWNPGIVEQQIGRVDRVGSHWANQLHAAIANKVDAGQLPRITVRPVIFKGTYDEYNWKVLQERWDDLQAQLHGVVIPPRLAAHDQELKRLASELEKIAPNFSPGSCS